MQVIRESIRALSTQFKVERYKVDTAGNSEESAPETNIKDLTFYTNENSQGGNLLSHQKIWQLGAGQDSNLLVYLRVAW